MNRRQALNALADWITFLFQAVPAKIRPTLLELLLGCIVARTGHISSALLVILPMRTWTAYYKVIQKGVFSWLALSKQWMLLLCKVLAPQEIVLAIDDTVVMRSSKKAPSAALHHDHAKRANRPRFIWGQLFVCAAMICKYRGRQGAFPLLMRMIPHRGNRSKINAATTLTKLVLRWIGLKIPVRLLLDAWYMKGPMVLKALGEGIHVLGQVRKDTALYLDPVKPAEPTPGRPRKYGLKLCFQQVVAFFDLRQAHIISYGQKKHLFQYYCFDARVRFLEGRKCRLVWSRLQKPKGKWSRWHLLLSTDTNLTGEQIIEHYASRWLVESCFNELKNLFGFKNTWQQTRQVAARWRLIVSLAYSLPRLMALVFGPSLGNTLLPIPWRKKRPMTAGWMAKALSGIFRNYRVRAFWDRKQQKCCLPEELLESKLDKAA